MIDAFLIQQVVSQYSFGASRGDWDQVLDTYLPDGVWAIPDLGARFEGHAAIREGLIRFSTPTPKMIQLNNPALIKVDGDVATAGSVIRECGKYADRDEALEVLGFYADRLVRTDQGWKFSERVFELRDMYNFPLSRPIGQQ